MEKYRKKSSIALAVVLFAVFVSFCFGTSCLTVSQNTSRGIACVYATEKTDDGGSKAEGDTITTGADTVTTGADDENQSSADQTVNDSDDEQKNSTSQLKKEKSKSTFFKWAIPITCILSLALAVFLAIRKANKKFGKGWE